MTSKAQPINTAMTTPSSAAGEQYKRLIEFVDRATANRFRDAVLAALDDYFQVTGDAPKQ